MLGMLGLKSKFIRQLGSSLVAVFNHKSGEIVIYDMDGVERDAFNPGDSEYATTKANTFPDVKVGDQFTAADKLAQDCAHKHVSVAMILRLARDLISEHGENSEYDRAIVELVIDICGLRQCDDFETVLKHIRKFGKEQ